MARTSLQIIGRDNGEADRRTIVRCVSGLAMLLCVAAAGTARAQCTNTPLPAAGIGPVNPANGYPRYYVDASGLALGPCLDPNSGFCLLTPADLPNPAAPVSFPGNFPEEWFYWSGDAGLTFPNGGKGLLVMAVEGAFLNGPVVPGDQITFSRLRIRANGLVPNNTYTVTHPYGVESLTADALGVINTTTDSIGLAATGFDGPTKAGSRIGPRYLVWDATAPAPPAGFVGDPAVDHTVTGSPCGTNFFRITGPGLPAQGVQTNLFSISGRVQDVCGNGILDVSEQCDDANRVAGDCCAPDCTFEPLGSACTSPSICTSNACNGAGVCGSTSQNDGIACTDGNACTVGDTCTAGTCLGGARNCDDGNFCTTDFCTPPAVGCENPSNAAPCDDGNAATGLDVCSGGTCMGAIRRATLTLNAGENPSVSAAFPAAGDARADGSRVRVSLINLDPARYPAGCAGATVTVGGISGTATVAKAVAQGSNPLLRTTAVDFIRPGTVAAGSAVDLRLSCTVGGVTHQTRWRGTMANVVVACTPTTCAAQGKNCGTIADGCGGTLTCGVCTAPQTCGGGGVANVCGVCTPTTCAAQGKNCGTIPDGCGGTLTCGVCTAPETCGGAGVANVCGVAPATALLTLTAIGRAGERILSTPAGLNVPVGTTGSASFSVGTSITLSATNGRSVIWSGVCSSGGVKRPTCTFTLNAASSETANVQ